VPEDERAQDLTFMRMALEEAARAPAVGEVPIAALIIHDGRVLAQAHNYRELWQDPTAMQR
jgi:tRNA(adenine34) deaminase